MKLLRAACPCGFQTRKVRAGYHFHQWWFPVLDTKSGELTDVRRALPEQQVDLIMLGDAARSEFHPPFLEFVTRELRSRFSSQPDMVFNPAIGSAAECPRCSQNTLLISQVFVKAVCKRGCGHKYEWYDSEQGGCPVCGADPSHFQTDLPEENLTVSSSCWCCCEMESASHTDAWCPACGDPPHGYIVNERWYCARHHMEMILHRGPIPLFMPPAEPEARQQFPNAKHYGDADDDDAHALTLYFCPQCEAEYQRWLEVERLTGALRREHLDAVT